MLLDEHKKVGQEVFYLLDNKIHSDIITEVHTVEKLVKSNTSSEISYNHQYYAKEKKTTFYTSKEEAAEDELFESRQALIDSL